MMLLEIKKLNKVYPNGFHAVKDLDLSIQPNEFVVLLGISGSGKSTLLRCINRLIEPTSGTIIMKQQDITKVDGPALRTVRNSIAMIFQEFFLILRYSVLLNVLTGALGKTTLLQSIFLFKQKELLEQAKKCINRVGLTDYMKNQTKKLSGGQKQRVAIARALMQKPVLLLADEPVSNLDPATSLSIMEYLSEINKQDNITVICSLHNMELAKKFATRIVALREGRVVFDGTPDKVTDDLFMQIYGDDTPKFYTKDDHETA